MSDKERAVYSLIRAHYLAQFQSFSDIQEERPAALAELEAACCR